MSEPTRSESRYITNGAPNAGMKKLPRTETKEMTTAIGGARYRKFTVSG